MIKFSLIFLLLSILFSFLFLFSYSYFHYAFHCSPFFSLICLLCFYCLLHSICLLHSYCFFHIISVLHCTIINVFEIIINTICDNTNFRLVISVVCISIIFVMINNLLFVFSFLIWRIELQIPWLFVVQLKPELTSKACWTNRLVLFEFTNSRILFLKAKLRLV